MTAAPNPQRPLRTQRTTLEKVPNPHVLKKKKKKRFMMSDYDVTSGTHLVFGHHVSSVDQWRSDGRFVLQRLAQERVMGFTYWLNHKLSRC